MNPMNIVIDASQVTPLAELAPDLARQYGWKSYSVEGDTIYFSAESGSGPVEGRLELSGFAYDLETDEPLDEWNVNWDEDFDAWSNHVWAEDEKGNTVMLHD